jgi:hypothetical protein
MFDVQRALIADGAQVVHEIGPQRRAAGMA